MFKLKTAVAGVLIVALAGCTAERKSASGFRLPDGDPERGRMVFAEMKCYTCHKVYERDDLPEPTADPSVPVTLGGRFARVPSDGHLVTSIIHPSHKISSRYAHAMVTTGNSSRMGDFTESMSVQELIDLVAFLHTVYERDEITTRPEWPHGGP